MENAEDENSKSRRFLYPSPGTKRHAALQPNRFAEILADGSVLHANPIQSDGSKVYFAANQAVPAQLLFASAGKVYLYDLAGNLLSQPAAAPAGVTQVDFSDGYFVALCSDSTFRLSNSLDGTAWSGINVAKVSVFPENLVGMICDHREICLFGQKRTGFYSDTGNTFPYDLVPGGFMEQGLAAPDARCRADNSIFFLGASELGQGIFWRTNGYNPVRVSNHALEHLWGTYPKLSDAFCYSFQMDGHTFVHLGFPSGLNENGLPLGASFRYDCASGFWHDVDSWDVKSGRAILHQTSSHVACFEKHFMGDLGILGMFSHNGRLFAAAGPQGGNVLESDIPYMENQQWRFADDAGTPIRRLRQAPIISDEQEWLFHDSLQIDTEVGLGPNPPFAGVQPPTTFCLENANGVFDVGVDDDGLLQVTSNSANSPQTYFLNDSAGGSWEIFLNEQDFPDRRSVDADEYPGQFSMVSLQGDKLFRFTVTPQGNFEVEGAGLIGRDPQMFLDWSDDGGRTWGQPRILDCGQMGEYRKRAIARRLARSRARIYRISCTDPIGWRIIAAYLKISGQ